LENALPECIPVHPQPCGCNLTPIGLITVVTQP